MEGPSMACAYPEAQRLKEASMPVSLFLAGGPVRAAHASDGLCLEGVNALL